RQSRRRLACQPMGRTHALELDAAGKSADCASSIICGLHTTLTPEPFGRLSARQSAFNRRDDTVPKITR
ncbi:hypothetical protein, partial [uncultured Sphingomonas sp.]|uniref:hypothetical protein n=1 Tax=uncultured Sphingomonas sp. TaxID=158754 RepID=UPI0025D6D258